MARVRIRTESQAVCCHADWGALDLRVSESQRMSKAEKNPSHTQRSLLLRRVIMSRKSDTLSSHPPFFPGDRRVLGEFPRSELKMCHVVACLLDLHVF